MAGKSGVLPFGLEEEEEGPSGMTALAGLPAYLELFFVAGLREIVTKHLCARKGEQGWTDWEMVLVLVLMNLAGATSVSDVRILAADAGFMKLFRKVAQHGMRRRERRALQRRWRREREGDVPSSSAIFRWLAAFHDAEQEKLRREMAERAAQDPKQPRAFIPAPNEHLQGLVQVLGEVLAFLQRHAPVAVATLDMDASLVPTTKRGASFCYEHYRAYQPLTTFWFEQGVVLHSEFRDGNVPAGFQQLRVLKEALAQLPPEVEKVRLRSDTAGYQHDLLRYCAMGGNERFGVIEFSVCCDVTAAFKKAVAQVAESDWEDEWRLEKGVRVKTGRQFAEVNFVPDDIAFSKKDPVYRYIATREPVGQPTLPGMEAQQSFPFATIQAKAQTYKLQGIVTNMAGDLQTRVQWNYQRCGKSEEMHAVVKEDMAGGTLPSQDFGENAAWWLIAALSANLNQAMKKLALGKVDESWLNKRMKAIRFGLINLPARVMGGGRQVKLRMPHEHPGYPLIAAVRAALVQLLPVPGG